MVRTDGARRGEREAVGGSGRRVTVEAEDVEGVLEALGVEAAGDPLAGATTGYDDGLLEVLETVADVYEGVRAATESDSRGRSRKLVRQYAGREDLGSDSVGSVLRVLEAHDLVVQDGNRWRLAAD